MSGRTRTPKLLAALLLAALTAAPSCVLVGHVEPERFNYFRTPSPEDPWSGKILGWQRRERADRPELMGVLPAVAEAGGGAEQAATARRESHAPDPAGGHVLGAGEAEAKSEPAPALRSEYTSFLTQRKRAAARDLADWVQRQAKRHYIPDGPIDHWATLEETLRTNGDDCDGLELLAFHALRDLGFDHKEVFRSIVYRPSDGQHHMVTLWFEDADDPWVIDPTGAMTTGLHRMSQLPEWTPLKIFTDSQEYTVERSGTLAHRPVASSP